MLFFKDEKFYIYGNKYSIYNGYGCRNYIKSVFVRLSSYSWAIPRGFCGDRSCLIKGAIRKIEI